jgi:hypothetical protein
LLAIPGIAIWKSTADEPVAAGRWVVTPDGDVWYIQPDGETVQRAIVKPQWLAEYPSWTKIGDPHDLPWSTGDAPGP